MADFESIAGNLTGELSSRLATFDSTIGLVLENSQHDGTPDDTLGGEQVRVRFRPAFSRLTEINGRVSFNSARMVCSIYTELGTGVGRSREIADEITKRFQGVRIGDASCQEVTYRSIGRDVRSPYWHAEAIVRFRWEHAAA